MLLALVAVHALDAFDEHLELGDHVDGDAPCPPDDGEDDEHLRPSQRLVPIPAGAVGVISGSHAVGRRCECVERSQRFEGGRLGILGAAERQSGLGEVLQGQHPQVGGLGVGEVTERAGHRRELGRRGVDVAGHPRQLGNVVAAPQQDDVVVEEPP